MANTIIPDDVYASSALRFAIKRQRTKGTPATQNMVRLRNTQVNPQFLFDLGSLGQEIGGTISQQRDVKQVFNPNLPFNGHMRVGGHMAGICALDYMPLSIGTDPVSAVTDSITAAVERHSRVLEMTDGTKYDVGDWIQIGALATAGKPLVTDMCEVREIVAVGPSTFSGRLVISGATGGTYQLLVNGVATADIAYNANAATIIDALEAISPIGDGNVDVVAASGGAGFVISGLLATASKYLEIEVDGSGLTPYGASAKLTVTTEGAAAKEIVVKGRMLYAFPAGTVVKQVKTKYPVKHYLLHIQPDHPLAADYFSVYLRWANTRNVNEVLMFDGRSTQFNFTADQGQLPSYQAQVNFLDITRMPYDIGKVVVIPDPSGIAVQNSEGYIEIMGNKYDKPRSFNLTVANTVYDDAVLTELIKQSAVSTEHAVSASYAGKFAKDYYDKSIFGGADKGKVTAAIFESPFIYEVRSAMLMADGLTPYGMRFEADDCQFGNYRMNANTNQPIEGSMESMKVVPWIEDDNVERWRFIFTNTCTTEVCGA